MKKAKNPIEDTEAAHDALMDACGSVIEGPDGEHISRVDMLLRPEMPEANRIVEIRIWGDHTQGVSIEAAEGGGLRVSWLNREGE